MKFSLTEYPHCLRGLLISFFFIDILIDMIFHTYNNENETIALN